jgi:hypothetical protein
MVEPERTIGAALLILMAAFSAVVGLLMLLVGALFWLDPSSSTAGLGRPFAIGVAVAWLLAAALAILAVLVLADRHAVGALLVGTLVLAGTTVALVPTTLATWLLLVVTVVVGIAATSLWLRRRTAVGRRSGTGHRVARR